MASLKASQKGLIQIRQTIARTKWTMSSDRWLVEASKVLDPNGNWHELGPYAYGCSPQTWKRFLEGTAIRDSSFIAFCQALGIDPEAVVESTNRLREDWGEAPDAPTFHGRQQELATLQKWLLDDDCRLISIVGLAGIGKTRLVRGGIGKTDLTVQLARRVRGEFEYLIWRRLLNAPPLETLLTKLIEFVSGQQESDLSATSENLIRQLLHYLKQRRCLLILDNVESILQPANEPPPPPTGPGIYRAGYEGYGELFRRIGETEHQSCLCLNSRVKPQDIEAMEGVWPVRSLTLDGLDTTAGRAIFQDVGHAYGASFQGSDQDWDTLVTFYNGNPLALEVVSRHLLRRFDGHLPAFLNHNLRVFGKIRELLDWHFDRLSTAEKTIMYWLAINREAVSIADLQADVVSPVEQKQIPETLDALERQLPIEKSGDRIAIQPVLMEYATDRLIQQVCHELQARSLRLFNRHALIKASAKEYVRESQIRIILKPVIAQLRTTSEIEPAELDSKSCLEYQLSQILMTLKRDHQNRPGYAAGNLLNLMRYGEIDISGYDFSHLIIWQAELQGLNLHRVEFTACKFVNTSFTQHFGGVQSIAFSPNQDLLAIGDSNGDIQLFCLKDRRYWRCLKGHLKNAWVASLAFSPDGKLLASGSLDYTVKLWDTQTDQCLRTLTGHQQWIWTVAFSPNGETLASGGDDNAIRLWNIHTGDCQVLSGHQGWVWAVAFNLEGDLIASGGYDYAIRLWNSVTGDCLKVLNGHENAVLTVAFHPNGKILASGSVDSTLKLWDVQTGNCLNTLKGHTKEVRSTAFSADGQVIASGSFDRTIKLWDVETGALLKTLRGHHEVCIVAVDPKTNILASGDNHQVLKLWDMNRGDCLKTWQGYANWMWALAFSPNGRLLASGSLDQTIRLWDMPTGQLLTTLSGHQDLVCCVAFSPDGQTLASSSDDGTIRLWDVITGDCWNILQGHSNGGVWSVDFSPDGTLIASGGQDGTLQIWQACIGECLQCLEAHSNWIYSVAFSPDGQRLISGSADQTLKFWDVKTGQCIKTIEDGLSKVMAIAVSPNGQTLISGEEHPHAKLWDVHTGDCIQTLQGHTDSIMSVASSPDGRLVASASADTTVRLWDAHTGKCRGVLEGHTALVGTVAFTPEGRTVASGSADGSIRLWDVATGRPLQVLRLKRPYEGMNISQVQGLTAAQEDALMALGAVK